MYKIMIVEDDATIAHALAAHLERWDYETRCVEDFKNILGSFAEFDPQLVLLDIMLPFLTGFIGARRSGRCRRYRSYSCLRPTTI